MWQLKTTTPDGTLLETLKFPSHSELMSYVLGTEYSMDVYSVITELKEN